MFDDLARLDALRVWHALWLERIDRKIAYLQQRQAEEEHGRRNRPTPPDWIVELGNSTGEPFQVHDGECGMTGRRQRAIGRDEARRLLTTGEVQACPICHPDTRLHIIDLAARRYRPCLNVRASRPFGCGGRGAQLCERQSNTPATTGVPGTMERSWWT